jgi:DNA-binding MarR family transcriptional regulator
VKSKDKKVGYYLERTSRMVKLTFLQAFKNAGYDLTTEQWVVIDILLDNNGLTQNEIAGRLYKNPPTISRILDLLAKKGIVERVAAQDDRRSFEIHLTSEGKTIGEKCKEIALELRSKSWEHLSDEEYATFQRIINQVFQNFENLKLVDKK